MTKNKSRNPRSKKGGRKVVSTKPAAKKPATKPQRSKHKRQSLPGKNQKPKPVLSKH